MKLLLDEDSQSRIIVSLLQAAGHDVQTAHEAGLIGKPDPEVFAYAKQSGRVLLTRNGKDFLKLHQVDSDHSGILIEYQDANPSKNMRYAQIVAAIGKLEASGFDLTDQCVSINSWR